MPFMGQSDPARPWELDSVLTPSALYSYYRELSQIPRIDLLDDALVGNGLGYSARTVGKIRRILQREGWIQFVRHTHQGQMYGVWYIGPDIITEFVG